MTNKILYSTQEDDFSNGDESIEVVAQQLWEGFTLEEQQECDSMTLYKGNVIQPKLSDFFNIKIILDEISSNAYDTCREWAEGYLYDVTQEQEDELTTLITSWADKHELNTNWFMVEDIEEVEFEIPSEWRDGYDIKT